MSSSGVIDQMDGHDPEVILTGHGSVLLDIDGDMALRFRTVAAFDAWLEQVDRSRAALNRPFAFRSEAEEAESRGLDEHERGVA